MFAVGRHEPLHLIEVLVLGDALGVGEQARREGA